MSNAANIFVAKDGQEIGPLTVQEFEERHRRLEFKVLDHAWREGMTNWTTVGNLMFIISKERAAGGAPASSVGANPPGTAGSVVPPAVDEEAVRARAEELQKRRMALIERVNRVSILTKMPDEEHRVITPIAFSIGNKGMFADPVSRLIEKHRKLLQERQSLELSGSIPMSSLRRLNIALSMAMSGPPLLEACYHMGIEELKERAAQLGGNALCSIEHRIESDPPNFQAFVIHFTAVVVKVVSADAAAAEAAAAAKAKQAMDAVQRTMTGAGGAEASAALEELRKQLEKQQEAIRIARDELRERERFLEESEARLFEKFQEQQVRETELDMREERIAGKEKAKK
jgi:hypothetical protein